MISAMVYLPPVAEALEEGLEEFRGKDVHAVSHHTHMRGLASLSPTPLPAWVAAMVKSMVGVLLSALQVLKHMERYLVRVSTNPPV